MASTSGVSVSTPTLSTTHEKKSTASDDVEESLRRREDDEWGSLARRLAVWREEAGEVLRFYRDKGKLAVVQAEAPPDEVMRRVEAVLEDTGKGQGQGKEGGRDGADGTGKKK